VVPQPHRTHGRVRNLRDAPGSVPTAQRMVFGNHLRRHRTALDLTIRDVSKPLGVSDSKISRMETGCHEFKHEDVRRLLDLYRIAGAERRELEGLAETANLRPWWQDWSDVTPGVLQTFVSLEEMAQRVRTYESLQLPGLLQIEDYARALVRLGSPDVPTAEVDRRVELRQERRKRFAADASKTLVCILDESTLIRRLGSATTMRRQLDHLIDLTDDLRYTFRIAELNKTNMPVVCGPATIFDFAEQLLPDIVYVENYTGGFILQEQGQVDEHVKAFDRLMVDSLNAKQSLQRLWDYRKKLG
jgi:hypothetical protein